MHLTESYKIVKTGPKTPEIFIRFFNILLHKNLDIPAFETNHDSLIDNVKDPTQIAVLNWDINPSVLLSIMSRNEKDFLFFSEVAVSEIAKEISKLKENKASQISNVLINVIKGSGDVYSDFLF